MNLQDMRLHRPKYYRLGPYEEVKINGESTVALLTADVTHVFLRVGSDAMRLFEGACMSVYGNFVKLVNPFHFTINVEIACGLPEMQGVRQAMNVEQSQNQVSAFTFFRPITVTGQKYGFGVMLKKGWATFNATDWGSDGFTSIIGFPNARADFLSFKPAGIMLDPVTFRRGNGAVDDNVIAVGGLYTDADVVTWCTAAGYTGQWTMPFGSLINNQLTFRVDTNTAIFVVKAADKGTMNMMRIQHWGANMEDFD